MQVTILACTNAIGVGIPPLGQSTGKSQTKKYQVPTMGGLTMSCLLLGSSIISSNMLIGIDQSYC